MTQTKPQTFMRKFYLWWTVMDAVMVRRGLVPLDYEVARELFECEIEPEALGETKLEPLDDRYFEARLMRRDAR